MKTNILTCERPEENISRLLALIGQPVRVQILFIIAAEEACVCHLEAALGLRQASISQHLMVLRKAGLVTTHRDGRNIFYRLAQPQVVDLLQKAAQLIQANTLALQALAVRPLPDCVCPQCNPDMDPQLACYLAVSKPHP